MATKLIRRTEYYFLVKKWCTLFENHPNVAFEFRHFSLIFVLSKLTCLVTLFDHRLKVYKNSPNWPFWHFWCDFAHAHCLKINWNVSFQSFNFCPTKIDLSGNTVWPQVSDFLAFLMNFLSTQNVKVAHFARIVESLNETF